MKIVKKIFKSKTFVDKNGKSHYSTLYVIKMENGKEIYIKPIHSEGYTQLDLICETKVYEK